ncbi:MAG: glycosyltransferase family 2 protein [Bacteroidales bacterium]|nr:glycosyltransferase family 2 protein [Bacteroidales bacterium]
MGFADIYFSRFNVSKQIADEHKACDAEIVVVIPVCNEPNFLNTIECFKKQEGNFTKTRILSVFNHSEIASDAVKQQNIETLEEYKAFISKNPIENIDFSHLFLEDIPQKNAGVGYARKQGMDEALRIFNQQNNPDGIIVSLDADCIVENNYLSEINKFFVENAEYQAVTIYFEHATEGNEYSQETYEAALAYESHLRCFRFGLEFAGYPHAIHTVGSCFAVLAKAYAAAGGMNTKQGGEDFYFLHKLTAFTNISCINSTCVYPDSRVSDRVPFGTGPAIQKAIDGTEIETYNPKLYLILKKFFAKFPVWYQTELEQIKTDINIISPILSDFCERNNFIDQLAECKANTSNQEAFVKRVFGVFNAFRIIKFLNEAPEAFYHKVSPCCAAKTLLELSNLPVEELCKAKKCLSKLRQYDKNR